jgi:hypothetical protein
MSDLVLSWVVLAVLAFLCLPLPPVRWVVFGLVTWAFRLVLLAALAGAAALLARPGDVAPVVTNALGRVPQLAAQLPDPATPAFALLVAGVAVAVCLPVLAVLGAVRRLGRRVRELERSAGRREASTSAGAPETPTPLRRPTDRREAAAAIAAAGSPRPAR